MRDHRADPSRNHYVIQHHTGAGRDHFDLMLERDATLWTWQIDHPLSPPACQTQAERIAGHRLAYLTYEGPIHGGELGACRIVARGRMRWLTCGGDELRVQLIDGTAAGEYTLTRRPGTADGWMIRATG